MKPSRITLALFALAVIAAATFFTTQAQQPAPQQPQRPAAELPYESPKKEPTVITPGATVGAAPSDAIVLFDGKDLSGWKSQRDGGEAKWTVKDGYMEVMPRTGGIQSKYEFGDCQLHIEWATPVVVKGEGQGRGNSGIFLLGHYEVQVLDSFQNPTYFHGQAGSIYKQYPPLVNPTRKPGEWQSYDIIFSAPHFNEIGLPDRRARITVMLNGVLVQNNVEIQGETSHDKAPHYIVIPTKGGLSLQDHGDLVRYRNIWVRNL
jgi:hypothetical protein